MGKTTLTLVMIMIFVSLAIVNLNNGREIPIVNKPEIDEFVINRVEAVTSLLDLITNNIKKPFDGKQYLYIEDQNLFVCPPQRNGLITGVSCVFLHADFVIHNVLDGIPSFGNYIFNAISKLIQHLAPEHFIVEDFLNSIFLMIQRFAPLNKPTYIKQQNIDKIEKNNTATSPALSKASFSFEPFSDDVIEVKEECESQCMSQTYGAAEFMFEELIDINGISSPISRTDYIFNELKAEHLYICQYIADEKFGGTCHFYHYFH